ncbi:hypothetical protein, partial [Streptomyces phytophilus]|uniref:hypothetical protein n=1 Tax=Streptomyces phytophilus TaxID=722715 RepID=UPI001C68D8AA
MVEQEDLVAVVDGHARGPHAAVDVDAAGRQQVEERVKERALGRMATEVGGDHVVNVRVGNRHPALL